MRLAPACASLNAIQGCYSAAIYAGPMPQANSWRCEVLQAGLSPLKRLMLAPNPCSLSSMCS